MASSQVPDETMTEIVNLSSQTGVRPSTLNLHERDLEAENNDTSIGNTAATNENGIAAQEVNSEYFEASSRPNDETEENRSRLDSNSGSSYQETLIELTHNDNLSISNQNRSQEGLALLPVDEATEICRKFNEFRNKQEAIASMNPAISTTTAASSTRICRICRYERASCALIASPCKCKGTLGFIHSKCLSQWQNVRKNNVCEICHHKYEIIRTTPFKKLFKTFFQRKYMGKLIKDVLDLAITTWLFKTNCCQMFDLTSALEDQEKTAFLLYVLCPILLLEGSGLILYAFAETVDSILYDMKETIEDWWWSAYNEDSYIYGTPVQ